MTNKKPIMDETEEFIYEQSRASAFKEFEQMIEDEEERINRGYQEKARIVIPHIQATLENIKSKLREELK